MNTNKILKIIGKILVGLLGLLLIVFLVVHFNGKIKRNKFLSALEMRLQLLQLMEKPLGILIRMAP